LAAVTDETPQHDQRSAPGPEDQACPPPRRETLQDIARSYNVSHPTIMRLFPTLSSKARQASPQCEAMKIATGDRHGN